MTLQDPYGFHADIEVFLEAEVADSGQNRFAQRYESASGTTVSPGRPPEFQLQSNKWGMEGRIYFNSTTLMRSVESNGFHIEVGRPYHPEYRYRINNNDLWWELVEDYQFRLGIN